MSDPADPDAIVARQARVMPPWFGPPAWVPPVLRVPLIMAADVAAWIHALILYTRKQSRITTADGGWLDLIAHDFFGARMRRRFGQVDESYRRRIKIEMFRARNTRPAMIAAVRDITGYTPRIFEPARPADTGGIGIVTSMGMGLTGAVGSTAIPGEVFIDIFRTPEAGIALAAGIGIPVGGIGIASRLVMLDLATVRGALTDEDIRVAVNATRPEGIRVWMRVLPASSL